MEIYLPKPIDENSQTGTPKPEWEAIEHGSHSQKKAIAAFETYISILSQKLRDIDVEGSELGKRIGTLDTKIAKLDEISGTTFNLVAVGFIALVVVVIIGLGGFLFGYLQLINSSIAREDSDLKAKQTAASDLQDFKNCILQNQGYWACLK